MSYQKHCPGCFVDKRALAVCPHCGYDESAPRPPVYLPHGRIVGGQYRIGRVLGRPGGFGITYLAWDVHLQQRVAIKEYLPRAIAVRAGDQALVEVPDAASQQAFADGLELFLREARLLARLDHPNVVRVRNFFRDNGTAYLVMDYYEGVSLGEYLAALPGSTVAPETAVRLLGPVLEGLQFVHDRGIVHRDIKPHNLYLASGGRVILLDFGSARAASAGASREAATVLLSEGYAPLEQYQREGELGPWTDLYGIAATLYRMLKGVPPPAALDRAAGDPLAEDLGIADPALAAVLRRGLALRPEGRPGSALALRAELFDALGLSDGAASPDEPETAPVDAAPMAPGPVEESSAPLPAAPDLRGAALIAGAILLGALMISATLWLRLP